MRTKPIELSAEEKATLDRWVRSSTAEQRRVFRARVVLLAAAGEPGKAIAKELRCRTATVSKWRRRFLYQRLDGLEDAARVGKRPI